PRPCLYPLEPQASSLKPQASSLKPQASSLKPQASSLESGAWGLFVGDLFITSGFKPESLRRCDVYTTTAASTSASGGFHDPRLHQPVHPPRPRLDKHPPEGGCQQPALPDASSAAGADSQRLSVHRHHLRRLESGG